MTFSSDSKVPFSDLRMSFATTITIIATPIIVVFRLQALCTSQTIIVKNLSLQSMS